MSDGTICTPDPAHVHGYVSHCLTRGESLGLMALVVTGAASAIATITVYILIIRNVIREHLKRSGKRLIQQPMDIYMLSLLSANFLHTLGALMNVKWIRDGKSHSGLYCSWQGALNQVGPVAVALNTLAITFVTFIGVWWGRGIAATQSVSFRLTVAAATVAALWLTVALLVFVPYGIYDESSELYFAPTPQWCTIAKPYKLVRLFAKYLWLWLACIISFLLYIPLALWSQGFVTVNGWRFRLHRKIQVDDDQGRRRLFLATIVYPLSNAVLIIPLSIVRWIQNAGTYHISATDDLAVAAVFDLSGLANVLLFFLIRPTLLLFRKDTAQCDNCQKQVTVDDAS